MSTRRLPPISDLFDLIDSQQQDNGPTAPMEWPSTIPFRSATNRGMLTADSCCYALWAPYRDFAVPITAHAPVLSSPSVLSSRCSSLSLSSEYAKPLGIRKTLTNGRGAKPPAKKGSKKWNRSMVKEDKNIKERRSRERQRVVHQRMEDDIEFLCGIDRSASSAQTTGNEKSSGLRYPKTETMHGYQFICNKLMLHGRARAIGNNRLEEFTSMMRGLFEESRTNVASQAGTPCHHIDEYGGRPHGVSGIECRKARANEEQQLFDQAAVDARRPTRSMARL